jgi:hypothetical protein
MLPQYSGGTAIGKNPFAVQVTSQMDGAQQMTINFTNNRLLGSANFLPTYKTSKARVCVTVGMMTTGYDCPDLLNLGCSVQSFRLQTSSKSKNEALASTISSGTLSIRPLKMTSRRETRPHTSSSTSSLTANTLMRTSTMTRSSSSPYPADPEE